MNNTQTAEKWLLFLNSGIQAEHIQHFTVIPGNLFSSIYCAVQIWVKYSICYNIQHEYFLT